MIPELIYTDYVFTTKAGVPFQRRCRECDRDCGIGRVKFATGDDHAQFFCPACGKSPGGYLPEKQLTEAGIALADLALVQDNQRVPDRKPDCPRCDGVCRQTQHEGRLYWACGDCAWLGSQIDARSVNWVESRRAIPYHVLQLRCLPYDDYLQTDHWRDLRERVLWARGAICCICRGVEDLQVHHNTYARKGWERLEDLVILCDRCHDGFSRLIGHIPYDVPQDDPCSPV